MERQKRRLGEGGETTREGTQRGITAYRCQQTVKRMREQSRRADKRKKEVSHLCVSTGKSARDASCNNADVTTEEDVDVNE